MGASWTALGPCPDMGNDGVAKMSILHRPSDDFLLFNCRNDENCRFYIDPLHISAEGVPKVI